MKSVPLIPHRGETEIAQYRISYNKGIGGGQSVPQASGMKIQATSNEFFSCRISHCARLKVHGTSPFNETVKPVRT